MNRQTLHQQLQSRLENLVERHNDLMQLTASIPQQQMNELLRELRISYELALTLHHQNAMQSMDDLDNLVGERFQEPVIPIQKKEPEASVTSPAPTPEKMEELSPEARQLAEDRNRTMQTSDINHRFEVPQTIAGKFRGGSTVADTIAGKNSTSSISETLNHKPVSDLRNAIGINERFLFTQFLFANNPEAFTAAVERLNSCNSWSEAKSYLDNEVMPRYGWDPSQGTVHQFMELVERRYSA
ncbi:MAG: hypothetical protein RL021_691 [Bacteroidota bacterium]|jgi:hypothetical protein